MRLGVDDFFSKNEVDKALDISIQIQLKLHLDCGLSVLLQRSDLIWFVTVHTTMEVSAFDLVG